jgi:hypothetical protein
MRLKKLSNGIIMSFLSAAPEGTQIKLGIYTSSMMILVALKGLFLVILGLMSKDMCIACLNGKVEHIKKHS